MTGSFVPLSVLEWISELRSASAEFGRGESAGVLARIGELARKSQVVKMGGKYKWTN
jgi:hypothetical protein